MLCYEDSNARSCGGVGCVGVLSLDQSSVHLPVWLSKVKQSYCYMGEKDGLVALPNLRNSDDKVLFVFTSADLPGCM